MLLSLLMLATLAAAPELRPAMVDWSGVSDATVRRCNLGLLQSLLLQGMVESGFAVVDAVGPRVIQVTLIERKGGIAVEARRDDVVARRRVPVPQRCDSTIGVELQAAARATATEVEEQTRFIAPVPASTAPTAPLWADSPRAPVETVQAEAPRASTTREWSGPRGRIGLGAGLSSAESPFAVLTGQLGVRYGGWWVAACVDAALRDSLGVIVLEPALGPEVSRLTRVGFADMSIGLAVQLLGHAFWRDDDRGGHLDVRVSAPLRVEHATSGFGIALVPTFRLRPVEHRVGDDLAYRVRHVGGLVAITFRIPP
ncbi:MAG: hypothetical protein ACAI38_24930 [Myxococcota bacterium]